jgi:hypothetical protein
MTNRWFADFDARAHKAFKRVGIAEGSDDADTSDSFYLASGGGPKIPCRIIVNRGVQLIGSQGQVENFATVITCFAADIGAAPLHGARFYVGAEVFTVDALDPSTDESSFVCVVKPGI